MKINIDDISGRVIKNNKTYVVVDNTSLKSLVVSKTILHPLNETTGHAHEGQEEVYQFTHGHGKMLVGEAVYDVRAGDVVLIPDGLFHKVYNESSLEDLTFVCVFDGKRSH